MPEPPEVAIYPHDFRKTLSTYGNPAGGNAWLDPILPYQTDATADNLGDGDTDFGLYQWDGIVGRISRNHDTPYDPQNPLLTLEREFHSIVGGPDQDGLFGLAEMEDDRFVVVGSTRELGFEAPLIGFPFTPAHAVLYPHRVATIVGLDAAPTRQAVPQPLQLESALALGSWGLASSHATDVLVQPRWFDEPRINAVYVVGTTNDPNFLLSVGATPTTMVAGTVLGGVPTTEWSTLEGDSDGFLVAGEDIPIADLLFMNTTQGPARGGVFVGGPGVDGLNGISAWSEHTDHVHVCGYSSYLEQYQIQVASFIHPFPFVPLRRIEFGTADSDRPTVLGFNNATDGFGAPSYQTAILGDFVAGGGIAVDARGRMTVVGATAGAIGYPVEGGGRSYRGDQDAVRTELDMLPIGVGRTDGTGSTLAGVSAPLPPAGFDGGTTPACLVAQTPFGIRVGEPLPNPYLRRMLIDLEGNNEEDWYPVIWASRPTELGEVVAAAIQIGLPTTAPVMLDSAELWTLNNPLVLNEVWLGNNQRSWGVPFTIPLPAGPAQFSAQVACLLVSGPLTSGACTGQLTTFAGPALFFEY